VFPYGESFDAFETRINDFLDRYPMPDPNVQSETDFLKDFLQNYENPRKLPMHWIAAYLRRDQPRLAVDVIRAWDKVHQSRNEKFYAAIFAAVGMKLVDLAIALAPHFLGR
jgi:hypothetical protein